MQSLGQERQHWHLPKSYAKTLSSCRVLHMTWEMPSIEQFLNDRLVRGRAHFSREDASTALEMP
jgi:hypothetical protein